MSWLKIDDGFPENEKVIDLSDRAFRLHVTALCQCAKNLTDGLVAERRLGIISAIVSRPIKGAVKELVEGGLWIDLGEGDYAIKDYLLYNPKGVDVKAARDEVSRKRSEAGKLGAQSRWQNGKPDGKSDGKPDGKVPEANAWQETYGPVPSRPVVNPEGFTHIVDTWLSNAPPLIKHRDEIRSSGQAQKAVAKAIKAYGLVDAQRAVVNYAQVLGSATHFFTHKWTLPEFFARGIHRFVDEAEPLTNFTSKETPRQKDRGMTFEQIMGMNGGEDGPRALNPFRSVA
jgi:hypothetical protein